MALRSRNTISGKEGRLFLDGEEILEIKTFTANVEKEKETVPIMGRRFVGHKTSGVSGSGDATLHKVTSRFIRIMKEYVDTGRDAYFTLQAVLDDQTSDRGRERVVLYEVNFDSVQIANLDVESAALEESVPFTFEGFDLPEALRSTF